jgi:predicted PP-loop superfamily ATPase
MDITLNDTDKTMIACHVSVITNSIRIVKNALEYYSDTDNEFHVYDALIEDIYLRLEEIEHTTGAWDYTPARESGQFDSYSWIDTNIKIGLDTVEDHKPCPNCNCDSSYRMD